jgi:hypothetical protein
MKINKIKCMSKNKLRWYKSIKMINEYDEMRWRYLHKINKHKHKVILVRVRENWWF